jgi:hypothetical protein
VLESLRRVHSRCILHICSPCEGLRCRSDRWRSTS